MSIECTACILRENAAERPYEKSRPLSVETISLAAPEPGEVLVKVAGAGLCHSDWGIMSGKRSRTLPLALGHEGSGEVVEVGAGIRDLRVGDHVVFQFTAACGRCDNCLSGRPNLCERAYLANSKGEMMAGGTRITDLDGNQVWHHGGVSCFAEYAVLDRGSVVSIDKSIPLADAALFGCAVMTGAGAVLNTAKVRVGEKVAVLGMGGVGLNGLMAAKLAGASVAIAIDIDDTKLTLAKELGATHVVNARSPTAVEEVRDITGGGVDHAVELAGSMPAMEMGWAILARGGQLVTAGLLAFKTPFSFPQDDLVLNEKKIVGSYMGSCVPARDIPRFLQFQQDGRMPVQRLIDRKIGFGEMNAAFDLLASGAALRQLLVPHG